MLCFTYDAFMKNETNATGIAEPPAEPKRDQPSATAPAVLTRHTEHPVAVPARASKGEDGEPHGPRRTILREYFESALVTVVMALFGITFIVQAVKVPTGSMQNTIMIGDHLLVNKFVFAPGPVLPFLPQREIRRGDIIVFKYPGNDSDPERDIETNSPAYKTNFVKRVIGLPGDRLEVRGTQVLVNGQVLPEHRLTADNPPFELGDKAPLKIFDDPPRKPEEAYNVYYKPRSDRSVGREAGNYATNDNPVTVPANHYFVMGDNRDDSSDSRFWGFVPRELVIGRAMFVYWSYDESAPSTGNPLTNFLQNTRWSRTGTMVK